MASINYLGRASMTNTDEIVYPFPGMEPQEEGSFAITLKHLQYILHGVHTDKGRTRKHFDTLWSTLLTGSGTFGLKRVIIVGRNDMIQHWMKSFPHSPVFASKKAATNRKKNKGKKKKAEPHQLPDYLLFVKYDPAEAKQNKRYKIDCSVKSGDLIMLMPLVEYRASSVIQMGEGVDGDVVVCGLGTAPALGGETVVTMYNDNLDCRIATVKEGSRLCIVNLRVEIRATSYDGCLVAEEGSAIRVLNCDIRPQDKSSLPHNGMFGGCFEIGGVETADLIDIGHGSTLLSEGCLIGPSTHSGIILRGKCMATIRATLITGTGRGDKIQRIDRIKGTFPMTIEGRCPAIAVSFAANARLEEISLVNNYGYPIQWLNADEEEGKVDEETMREERSPEEYADYIVNKRAEVSVVSDFFLSCHGIDLKTPEGRAKMREDEIKSMEKKLIQIPIKKTPGCVDSCLCKHSNNALSRYLSTDKEEHAGSIPVQSWFDKKTKLGRMLDRDGDLVHDNESPDVCNDKSEWRRILEPPQIVGFAHKFKPKEISTTASLFKSIVRDKELQSRLSKILSWRDRNCRDVYFREDSQELDWEGKVKAYAVLDDGSMQNLRERLISRCSKKQQQICAELDDIATKYVDVEEARRIAWGALAQIGKRHPAHLTALSTVVALHADAKNAINQDRAHVLVACLECDDMGNSDRAYEDACDCEDMGAVQAVIQVLSELHPSIADALVNLLGNMCASDHGRSNAAEELANLASRQPDLRRTAIDAISASLIETSKFSKFSRGSLVGSLQDLRAKECSAIVRKAYKRGLIDEVVSGGYIDYLLAVSLPVDTKDKIVKHEVKHPSFMQFRNDDPSRLKKQSERISQYRAQKISEHNKNIGDYVGDVSQKKQACSFCGRKPRTVYVCSGCNVVAYCGNKCQSSDWKDHKRVCRSRKKSRNPGSMIDT